MDHLNSDKRSWLMSRICSKDTTPERFVRSLLHRNGFRFRLYVKALHGSPDIVLPKYKMIVDVRGCFWHKHENCKYCRVPSTHSDLWINKMQNNALRDKKNTFIWQEEGWSVFVVWSCLIKHVNNSTRDAICQYILASFVESISNNCSYLEVSWDGFAKWRDSLHA